MNIENITEKYCFNCGTNLPTDADFCGNCGARQKTIEVQQRKKNKGLKIGVTVVVIWFLLAFVVVIINTVERSNEDINIKNAEIVGNLESKIDSFLADEEKKYKEGVLTETSYKSEFIGIKFTVPDGWALKTKDEILELNTYETTTWEMMAVSLSDGSNVMLGVEKLPTKNISETAYIDVIKSKLKDTIVNEVNDREQVKVSDIIVKEENDIKMIANKNYYVFAYTMMVNGTNVTQTYYLRKIDNYMVILAVTPTTISNNEILSYFKDYDVGGNTKKEVLYNEDGSIDCYYESEYDSNGHETKCTWYNADGKLDYYTEREYDKKENETKCTWYNADGTVDFYTVKEYDTGGKQIKTTTYYSDGTKEVTTY